MNIDNWEEIALQTVSAKINNNEGIDRTSRVVRQVARVARREGVKGFFISAESMTILLRCSVESCYTQLRKLVNWGLITRELRDNNCYYYTLVDFDEITI